MDTDIPFRLALIQLIGSVILMSVVAWQVILLFLVVFALSVWYMVNKKRTLVRSTLKIAMHNLVS